MGHLPSFFFPTPGNLPFKAKINANAQGSGGEGKGVGGLWAWVQLELTDALASLCYTVLQLALAGSTLWEM